MIAGRPCAVGEARVGQRLLGLGRVERVQLDVGRVAGAVGRDEAQRRLAQALEHVVHVVLAVKRLGERLADLDIVERRLRGVEAEVEVAGAGQLEHLLAQHRVALGRARVFRRDGQHIQLALLVRLEGDRRVVDDDGAQFLDLRRAFAVVRVGLEGHALLALVLAQDEGAVADVVLAARRRWSTSRRPPPPGPGGWASRSTGSGCRGSRRPCSSR